MHFLPSLIVPGPPQSLAGGKAGNRFLVTLVGRANLGSDLAAQDSARVAFAALPAKLGLDQAVHTRPSPSGANVQQS